MAQDQWDAIITGQQRGPGAAAARGFLAGASRLYGFGLAANHWLYDSGFKPHTVAPMPVISIGNLTMGGTGKTTAAAYVARLLMAETVPGIVLRGYRRSSADGPLIVSDGARLQVELEQSGDEARMLAQMLPGCAVAVGKRREQVIAALKEHTDARVAILDDGLQYFRMKRDLEIVLVDALAEQRALRLFPAGRLREPFERLRQAQQVWITHSDLASDSVLEGIEALVRDHCPEGHIARTIHRSGALRSLDERPAPDSLKGLRVLALSGLGNPDSFERSVARLGASVRAIRFPDHHAYTEDDLTHIASRGQAVGADLIVTTAKDAVKLPGAIPGSLPAAVLECEMELVTGARIAADEIMSVGNAR